MRLWKLVTVTHSLALSATTHAAIIDNVLRTLDIGNGLEWLDVYIERVYKCI